MVYHTIGSRTTFGKRFLRCFGNFGFQTFIWFSVKPSLVSCLNVIFILGIFVSFHAISMASCPPCDFFFHFAFLSTLADKLSFMFLNFTFTSLFILSMGYPTFESWSNLVSGLGVTLGTLPSLIPPKLNPWHCGFGKCSKFSVLFWLQDSKGVRNY